MNILLYFFLLQQERTEDSQDPLWETSDTKNTESNSPTEELSPHTECSSKKRKWTEGTVTGPINDMDKLDISSAINNQQEVFQQQPSATNEFTQFGRLVATQLQTLPLEEAIKLEADIQHLISAARLRCIKYNATENNHFPESTQMISDDTSS